MKDEQALKETLSALLDGEAGKIDQLELRRLARAIEEQPDVVESYRRYVLARAAMRGECWPADSKSFLEKVRTSLAETGMDEIVVEDSVPAVAEGRRPWLRHVGRVAVAASVAVVAVILLRPQPSASVSAQPVPVAVATTTTSPVIAHNTRLVDPEVIMVGTGNHATTTLTTPRQPAGVDHCVLGEPQLDQRERVWEKSLPDGYRLCRQNQQSGRCEPVASAVGCYRQ